MTVGSEFGGKGEDVTVKMLSLLRIKMYSGPERRVLIYGICCISFFKGL